MGLELQALGPAPFGGMVLGDLGADEIRVDRVDGRGRRVVNPEFDLLGRSHRSVAVDLTHPDGAETLLSMVEQADVLLEGLRPGVVERLGVGPDECCARNPRLIYARMTGWGQDGPLAAAAGHDINYIALAGALHTVGRRGDGQVPPVNLVGDFGGGGMLLAVGVLAALVERATSSQGQVIDAAMVDGAALLTTSLHGWRASGQWHDERGTNAVDSGSHYYDTYETADGRHISIGPVERPFYAELLERLGLAGEELPEQYDRASWPAMKDRFAAIFRQRSRAEWCDLLEGTDVCFAPVLSLAEAPGHEHNRHRGVFCEVGGITQPAPAPRFSRTGVATPTPAPLPGSHTTEVLRELGLPSDRIAGLAQRGVIHQRAGDHDARHPR